MGSPLLSLLPSEIINFELLIQVVAVTIIQNHDDDDDGVGMMTTTVLHVEVF